MANRAAERTSLDAGASSRAAVVVAWLFGAVVVLAVGHFLAAIPIQLTDSFGNMLKLGTGWRELMIGEFTQRSYLRPFLWAELKLVYDVSGGNFTPWFRGVHVAQLAALVALFLALIRPRSWLDTLLVPLGLAVLLGIHTFRGTIVEAFPVNTFLTIVLCCLAAANLALIRYRWFNDAAAVLLFLIAALTVESGLLVAVVFIAAALVGAKGVSRGSVAAIALLFVGYFALRFAVLNVGSPGLIERASGYGFYTLQPRELMERFGDHPLWFYAYNIVTSGMSVLLSEPRAGTFGLVHGIMLHDPYRPAIVNVIASLCATAVIGAYAWRRCGSWRNRQFDRDDRIVLIFLAVLCANAVISYPYTKDVIMSPAGAFLAAAVFVAARATFAETEASAVLGVGVVLFCATLGVTWAMRFAALPLSLRETTLKVRTEWAYAHDWFVRQNIDVSSPHARRVLDRLRNDAMYTYPPPPRLWITENRWLDVD